MSLLAKRSIIKDDKTNIITLGSIAKEMKAKNKDVVNATIGMYYQDNGKSNIYTKKAAKRLLKRPKTPFSLPPIIQNLHFV